MRLRLNLATNKTLRNKNQMEMFSKILNNNKNKKKKRTDLSGENYMSLRSNKENLNILNMNNYSILEYNNTNKEKKKLKRGIHSASLLKSRNSYKKEDNNYPNIIYNIKHIHQIVSFIEKKINSLNDISKDNLYYTNYFSSIYNYHDKLTRNEYGINKGNINEKTDNLNLNIFKKNNELIPYPFKRLQNKIRRYFALSKLGTNNNKEIKENKLPEEQKASGYNFYNKYLLKIDNINLNKNKFLKNKKEINNKFRNKIFKNNNYNKKSIIKKDKSVSTENILIKRNNNDKKLNSLFNNQLLASLTNYSENKFFLTTGDKKRNKKYESSRSILVYHKNY